MSVHLSNFLIEASENPGLLLNLRSDPEVVAEAAGLNSKEVSAILSEDQGTLQSTLTPTSCAPDWFIFLLPPTQPEENLALPAD